MWDDSFVRILLFSCFLLLFAAGCSRYSCKYKGTDYHEGDTWIDGCQACRCPAEGSKATWCNPPASCADASVDGQSGAAGGAGNGGSGNAGGAASGGAGASGGVGAGGAGGAVDICASAALNATCTAEGSICGTCAGPCQGCSRLQCQGGRWQTQEIAPAPCFACGTSGLRCQIQTEYCWILTGPGPAMCRGLPSSCQPVPSCDCLTAVSNCMGSASGGLTLTVQQ